MKKKYYGEFYKTDNHFRSKEVIHFKSYEPLNTKDCLYVLTVVSIIFLSLFFIWR